MTQISKRSSFSLLRTNPRLTTNIKIVNSNNRVYLDAIEADPVLTKSIYKKFDVTGGTFSYDIYNFYNRTGKLPLNLAYKPLQNYSYDNVKSSLSEQYDFVYSSGAYTKNSALYDEEFAIFAPLWVEKDNIPEYFIILKLEGPVTRNSKDSLDLVSLDNEINSNTNFFDNYVKGSKLVKTINLKDGTNIGNYIRTHANDSSFPDGSIYATIKKNELSYINGISYHNGGFCQVANNFYDELVLSDKTILEKDNTITNKFMDLGVIHPNILNLEFLFDDNEEYEINRYMGFYVSEAQLTQFKVTQEFLNSKSQNNVIKVEEFLSNKQNISLTNFYNRMPYVKDVHDNIHLISQDSEFQKINEYVDTSTLNTVFNVDENLSTDADDNSFEVILPWHIKYNNIYYNNLFVCTNSYITFGGPASDYADLGSNKPSLPTIFISGADNSAQHIFSGIHPNKQDAFLIRYEGYFNPESPDGTSNIIWEITFFKNSGNIEINIISNDRGTAGVGGMSDGTNWLLQHENFTSNNLKFSVDENFNIINLHSTPLELVTKTKYLNNSLFSGYEPTRTIDVLKTEKRGRSSFVFKVNGPVSDDTQIRIDKTELNILNINDNDPSFDYFGVRGHSTIAAGEAQSIVFSINGNSSDIAKAIAKAINNIEILAGEQIFSAIAQNDYVIVYIKIQTSFWDTLKWSIFSTAEEFPFTILNQNVLVEDAFDYILTLNSIKDTYPIIDDTLFLQGKKVSSTFKGGSDRSNNRLIISIDRVNDFYTLNNIDSVFVKGSTTYSEIENIACYLDEPLYDKDGVIYKFNDIEKWGVLLLNENSNVTYNNKVIINKEKFPVFGYFSFFPIKDFDFDMYNLDYTKCEDSKLVQLWNYYLSKLNDYVFVSSDQDAHFYKLNTLLGIFDNEFLSAKGYTKLNEVNFNEDYDILKEIAKTNNALVQQADAVLNEYDRLNEKYLTTFATFSKVVPFVNKWVGDDLSTDVRNNNYRLNVDQSFGHLNFSPSFDYFNRDPRYFTHEWYLLQKYPPYFTKEDKINSYSYFDTNINESLLKSTQFDYFNDYFTRRFVEHSPIKTDYKYSIFSGGSSQKFAECIFRGVKVRIKKRIENSLINYNLKDKKLLTDRTYNGWKFAAVLALNNENEVGTSIKFIKNSTFNNITCLIKTDLSDFIQNDFIDRTLLYTINHRVQPNNDVINYADKVMPGQIYKAVRNSDGTFKILAKYLNNRNFPNFKNDIILNANNSYNDIIFKNSSNNITIKFIGINSINDNDSFNCTEIKVIYDNTEYPIDSFNIENNIIDDTSYLDIPGLPNSDAMNYFLQCIKSTDMLYEGGGYNGYHSIIKDISFANLANSINLGDPKIQYIEIDENGNELNGNFIIELIKPDTELSSTYLEAVPILPNKDINELNSFNIFGYDLAFKNRTTIQSIYRNQFYFNPKVYDVVKFCDDSNIEQLMLKNTKFFLGDSFNIKNLFFNKINTQNNVNILKLTNLNQYPLIDQCAISKKDFNIFKSNWDTNYYNEFITEKNSMDIIGTAEQFEQRSFFGSKLMLIPKSIQISYIGESPINSSTNTISIEELKNGVIYEDSKNTLKINILTDILLQNFLLNEPRFVSQFSNYINENYSFGQLNLEDDIRRYISLNIKQRYIIKDIVLWKKSISYLDKSANLFKLDLNETQKMENSFNRVTNFINEKRSSFDNLITYNKKLDETEQFSLTINLLKI